MAIIAASEIVANRTRTCRPSAIGLLAVRPMSRRSSGRRFSGADEGAQELPVHLGGDRVGVETRSGQELARVHGPVDSSRLEVDRLKPCLGQLLAVFFLLQSAGDAPDPELHA